MVIDYVSKLTFFYLLLFVVFLFSIGFIAGVIGDMAVSTNGDSWVWWVGRNPNEGDDTVRATGVVACSVIVLFVTVWSACFDCFFTGTSIF